MVIARLGEGQHFGETALISNAPQHATVRAVSRVRVAMLGKKKFQHMLRFVHPAQGDLMHAVNQRARKQSVEREKAAAQIREDQIP
jgi:CRP-like cAMP-binding protein